MPSTKVKATMMISQLCICWALLAIAGCGHRLAITLLGKRGKHKERDDHVQPGQEGDD